MANPPKKKTPDDEFHGFDMEFQRMRQEMERLMGEMMSRIPEPDLGKLAKEGKGGVYGFSVRVGQDGKPVVREFGNVKAGAQKEIGVPISEEREPLVDVIEMEKVVTVIVELPGVEKKDILVEGNNTSITINVASKSRKYYKELGLPAGVDMSRSKASYNNGVLEIVAPKGIGKGVSKVPIN